MDQQSAMNDSRAEVSSLTVPPNPRYARVVRMTAANVASLAGMSVDDVDDARMAAEEAFICACSSGVDTSMNIRFAISSGSVDMTFELGKDLGVLTDDSPKDPALAYARLLLDALCDTAEVAGQPAVLHLVKKSGTADAF